jgi:hypothetical protein
LAKETNRRQPRRAKEDPISHVNPVALGFPAYDFPFWADHRQSLPKFDDFMKIRQARDHDGVFFTRYWRQRFTGHG